MNVLWYPPRNAASDAVAGLHRARSMLLRFGVVDEDGAFSFSFSFSASSASFAGAVVVSPASPPSSTRNPLSSDTNRSVKSPLSASLSSSL